jgi:hypothetical protein
MATGELEWQIMAEGMRIVDPGRNRMMSLRSQRTRCPPRSGLKRPRAVMAHQPQERLLKSRWGTAIACGPKLKVQAAKTDPTKFQTKDCWDSMRMVICTWMNDPGRLGMLDIFVKI